MRSWVAVLPFLIATVPILSLWADNAGRVAPTVPLTLLAGAWLAGGLLLSGLRVALRDLPRAAVLALGIAGGGLRRAEIAGADLHDLDQNAWVLTVVGKGNRVREVPLKNGTVDALRAWLAHRRQEAGPLLCPVLKGGRIQLRRISEEAIYRICEASGEASIPSFTPHDMRRTYISTLLDRGVDLSVVSKLAGHQNPNVTARYDRRDERAKHAAAETITLPYVFQG